MKIMVLNGSPKSNNSVTLQSMNFLKLKFSDVEFEHIHLISSVRKGNEEIKKVAERLEDADGIIWSFPLYHLLVPAHMKVFIEKIFELKLKSAFFGKYTTAFSTSIHFYDNTAHDYIEGICNDLNMNYIAGLSHDMNDLLKEDKRKELIFFFENFIDSIKNEEVCIKRFKPLTSFNYEYTPSQSNNKIKTTKRTVIITDAVKDTNIDRMIDKFTSTIDGPVKIVNLWDVNMDNFCIGCCNCAPENICVFNDKDDYRKTLDEIIDDSDIIIYASQIKDRYFSSRFKQFFDRSFCYTHIPTFAGRQVAFLVSGPVSEIPHMHEIMYAYGTDSTSYVGMVSDECQDNKTLDSIIETLAKKCIKYSENNYMKTVMFQSVGAKKIFTDFVKGTEAGIFVCDYDYYKKNGYFTKPSASAKMKTSIFRFLMGLKPFSSVAKKDMYGHMVAAHKKVLESEETVI